MVNIYYEYYHALQESALIDEELGETNEFGDETRRGPHWFYSGASSYMADYAVRKRNPENNLDEMKIWLKQQFLFGKSLVEQNGCNEIRLKDISPENCFLYCFGKRNYVFIMQSALSLFGCGGCYMKFGWNIRLLHICLFC